MPAPIASNSGKLLKRLDKGDVLIVTRLDRPARSTRDLLNILDTVAKAGAGFRPQPIPGLIPRPPTAGERRQCWAAWPSSSASSFGRGPARVASALWRGRVRATAKAQSAPA